MARSCGIRIGSQRFELVTLEGSAKKPKLRFMERGRAADTEEGEEFGIEGIADALRELTKRSRKQVDSEEVRLSVDSGVGVYRHLSLPFADRAKIEDVLKFEVESQIPQWDVDDLVVDFLVTKSSPVESDLLVTACPKGALSERIDACADAGLEPLDAELESTALFTAAEYAGVLDPEGSTLLVHVAERATSLVVAQGDSVVTMRALHVNVQDAIAEEGLDEEGNPLPPHFDAERGSQVLSRLQREILRTLTSSEGDLPFTSIHVSGVDVPGLVGTDIDGLSVQRLDPLAELAPEMPPEERSAFAVAFGTALRGLGGGSLKTHLRREELAFAGTFERLELPLGVLGLLLLTFLASLFIILQKRLEPLKVDANMWMSAQRNYIVGQPQNDILGYITTPPDNLKEYVDEIAEWDGDPKRTPNQQLNQVGVFLDAEMKELRKKLGTSTDVAQPMSALTAATVVLDVFERMKSEETIGRFSIRDLDATYIPAKGARSTPDHVVVKFSFTLWGKTDVEAREYYNDLMKEFDDQPWALDVERQAVNTLEEGIGIFLQNVKIQVDTNAIPQPGI